MSEDTNTVPGSPSALSEDSLVVEIVWHDNQWRGACKKPLENKACLVSTLYIWGDDTGNAEQINVNKRTACGDPSVRGRCNESGIFLNWR
jgi:hypothetical protein